MRRRSPPSSLSDTVQLLRRPLPRGRPRRKRARDPTCLAVLAGVAIAAFGAHLVFADPAWSTATAGVFWVALAGIVAWALKRLGVGAEALRLIKAVRGK